MFDIHRLPNCLADERLVYFLRRHPITLTGVVIGYVLLFLLPIAGLSVLQLSYPDIVTDPLLFPLVLLAGSFVFLFCWLFLFQAFLDYYLDIWVVTNHRIINISQTGLFHREVSELRLYRVQDASAAVSGFIRTVFNYGSIEIQTAGEKSHFIFEDIAHPQEVSKNILQLAEKDRADSIDTTIEELEIQGNRHRAQRPNVPPSTEKTPS